MFAQLLSRRSATAVRALPSLQIAADTYAGGAPAAPAPVIMCAFSLSWGCNTAEFEARQEREREKTGANCTPVAERVIPKVLDVIDAEPRKGADGARAIASRTSSRWWACVCVCAHSSAWARWVGARNKCLGISCALVLLLRILESLCPQVAKCVLEVLREREELREEQVGNSTMEAALLREVTDALRALSQPTSHPRATRPSGMSATLPRAPRRRCSAWSPGTLTWRRQASSISTPPRSSSTRLWRSHRAASCSRRRHPPIAT